MTVEVWWARIADARPGLAEDLDASEQLRLAAYTREEDRARFLVGCAVVRRVLGIHLLLPPAKILLDRACSDCGRPHGKVQAIDAEGIQFSVSHSGDLIVVAFNSGTPVGVDVEQVDPAIEADSLAAVSLAEVETKDLTRYGPAERAQAFTTYWTRKEAVVKATGHGMRANLWDVVVSSPDRPAALLEWPGYDGPIALTDLDAGAGYTAALAVLSDRQPEVHSIDAGPLLSLGSGPLP
jgi:4'-phosphopantetheinyl transferase